MSYALKKLERIGVVKGERSSKEVFYSVTDEGAAILKRYAEIREQCLTSGLDAPGGGRLNSAASWRTRCGRCPACTTRRPAQPPRSDRIHQHSGHGPVIRNRPRPSAPRRPLVIEDTHEVAILD